MILVVYLLGLPVGFVIGTRFGYKMALDGFEDNDPIDRVMGMAMGVMVGLLAAGAWPLMLVVWLARRFLFESKADRRERELDEREAHIEQMEREAGIPHES